jgi:hypothetical protein
LVFTSFFFLLAFDAEEESLDSSSNGEVKSTTYLNW